MYYVNEGGGSRYRPQDRLEVRIGDILGGELRIVVLRDAKCHLIEMNCGTSITWGTTQDG